MSTSGIFTIFVILVFLAIIIGVVALIVVVVRRARSALQHGEQFVFQALTDAMNNPASAKVPSPNDKEFPAQETWDPNIKLNVKEIACPSCDAPVSGVGLVTCEYCGSTVDISKA